MTYSMGDLGIWWVFIHNINEICQGFGMQNLIIARVIILFIVVSGLVGCFTTGSIKQIKNLSH